MFLYENIRATKLINYLIRLDIDFDNTRNLHRESLYCKILLRKHEALEIIKTEISIMTMVFTT